MTDLADALKNLEQRNSHSGLAWNTNDELAFIGLLGQPGCRRWIIRYGDVAPLPNRLTALLGYRRGILERKVWDGIDGSRVLATVDAAIAEEVGGGEMPWTKKQQHLAEAVKHGFKPTGKAKGFSKKFADEVVEESKTMPTRPAVKSEAEKRRRKRQKRAEFMMGKGARIAGE